MLKSGHHHKRSIFHEGSLADIFALRQAAVADEKARVRTRYQQIWSRFSTVLEPELDHIEEKPDGKVVVHTSIPYPAGLKEALEELVGAKYRYRSNYSKFEDLDVEQREMAADLSLILTHVPVTLTVTMGDTRVAIPFFGSIVERSTLGVGAKTVKFDRLTMADTRDVRDNKTSILSFGFVPGGSFDRPYNVGDGHTLSVADTELRLESVMEKAQLQEISRISASFDIAEDYFTQTAGN